MTKTYSVGWYKYTPEQLEQLYPNHPEYRKEAQSIQPFGHTEACWKETPEEAQTFLDQILRVNDENNLKALTQLGASGLFVIERSRIDGACISISRFMPKAFNLVINAKGESTEDLLLALEEVIRLVEEGCVSGHNSNTYTCSSFNFDIDEDAR